MNEVFINTLTLPMAISGAFEIAWAPFVHADRTADFDILIYVTEGEICVTEEEQDYVISENQLFFLKKGLHHYGKREIPQGTSWYYIHFRTAVPPVSCLPFSIESEQGNQGLVPHEISYELPLPKQISLPPHSRPAAMIREFIDYLNSTDPLRRWQMNSRLFQLLTECALYAPGKLAESPSLSRQICAFLGEHVRDPFSSAPLEEQFHLSYKYMASLFKKETGSTICSYHTGLKLNLACLLLRSTLRPIKEISLELGYQDMLYFSRIFHKHMGCSPSAYRKRAEI